MRLEACPACGGRGVIRHEERTETTTRIWGSRCQRCQGLGMVIKHKNRGDEIRRKNNSELAAWLYTMLAGGERIEFCRGDCEMRDRIKDEGCIRCLARWLDEEADNET